MRVDALVYAWVHECVCVCVCGCVCGCVVAFVYSLISESHLDGLMWFHCVRCSNAVVLVKDQVAVATLPQVLEIALPYVCGRSGNGFESQPTPMRHVQIQSTHVHTNTQHSYTQSTQHTRIHTNTQTHSTHSTHSTIRTKHTQHTQTAHATPWTVK